MRTLAYYITVAGVAIWAYVGVIVPTYQKLSAEVEAVEFRGVLKAPD